MKTSASILTALSLALAFPTTTLGKDTVRTSRGSITLPTYPWAAVKHPYFRGTDRVNIYPYPMLDFLSRDPTNRTYQTVVLENDFLRITFLPELGGKIHEVIDKTTGQEMFYVNHVIKPALIGQAGAWTSGGVEWNTGPQGHTVGCMQPVPVVILPREKDGSQSVAIGETERIYGTKWTVVVTLRPGRSFIEERIRIYNPTETIRPYYFWNCTAAPNTKGFRFIYPMTLGTDHGAERFFNWPIHEGKDLSRGTNYQDASSIFAWHCDQDFFGSYNDDLDRGVVAYANHHQLPGKKAWTWGWGSYGTMHQMDLTDNDGPYNEVQTGPLLTQGEVGRLDPCEAVEWQEWWYPIHGIGGFTFANKDVAVQAEREDANLNLRAMSSGVWNGVGVKLWLADRGRTAPPQVRCNLSPGKAVALHLPIPEHLAKEEWFYVELSRGNERIALFPLPLHLPKREPPAKEPAPQTGMELAQAGWEAFLFARFPEAESNFRKALEADPKSVPARTGLAFLRLDSDPEAAMQEAAQALETAPDSGLAHYARAVAAHRADDRVTALDEAWRAALDPAVAVAARALIAKLLIRQGQYSLAIAALSESGPWRNDLVCRNRLALAALKRYEQAYGPFRLKKSDRADLLWAASLAQENLELDPLDPLAGNIRYRTGVDPMPKRAGLLVSTAGNRHGVLDLLAEYSELKETRAVMAVFPETVATFAAPPKPNPIELYWLDYLASPTTDSPSSGPALGAANWPRSTAHQLSAEGVFPWHLQTVPMLRWELAANPSDGNAALFLGHLLFHLGRHAEGRAMWQKAAELGAEPVIAYRALGMAAKTLDNDLKSAREWLEKASQADPLDAIVARDLANVLFALADKADSDAGKRELTTEARDRLQGAFEQGKGRSDFVALLARSHSRLGETAETAKLLDSVRITIWEGAHEAHDLFEEAHLALGDGHMKAGRPAEALAEFNRALEYPKNLATGRLENTCDAHIHFRRGQALAALGRKDDAVAAWRQAVAEPASRDSKKEQAREQAREALREAAK